MQGQLTFESPGETLDCHMKHYDDKNLSTIEVGGERVDVSERRDPKRKHEGLMGHILMKTTTHQSLVLL